MVSAFGGVQDAACRFTGRWLSSLHFFTSTAATSKLSALFTRYDIDIAWSIALPWKATIEESFGSTSRSFEYWRLGLPTSHEGKTPGVFYPDCVGQGSASELTSLRSPRDLNGYGYFHARLGWTGFGLRANIVEKYVLFSAMLHVAVALERNRADPVVHLVVTLRCKFLGSCGYVREPWRLVVMNAG